MKSKKKVILSLLILTVLGISALAIADYAGTERFTDNKQLAGDRAILFGDYPNASIKYSGGNLTLSMLHGGGKVSIVGGGLDMVGNMSLNSSLVFDGATADSFKTTLSVVDPTSSTTATIPNQTGTFILSTAAQGAASSVKGVNDGFEFEGPTADAFETTLTVVDPTADQTWSIPNFAVNAAFLGSTLTTNTVDAANSLWGVSNGLKFEGATANSFETTLTVTDPTAARTVTLPDATGTVCVGGALVVSTGANTACNTTCGAGKCCGAQDTAAGNIVGCADATADRCSCMP